MSSKKWMYVGFATIFFANFLQTIGTFLSWMSPWISVVGIAFSTVGAIFTIFQARKSAVETSQEIWKNTPAGHLEGNLHNADPRPPSGR
jgi:hypothetical protein